MSSVKVAVRCRPFNSRETARNAKCIIEMQEKSTKVINPATGKPNTFAFDFSHWSFEAADSHFATQDMVYQDLGVEMLDHAFEGYNVRAALSNGLAPCPLPLALATRGLAQPHAGRLLVGWLRQVCIFAYGQTGSGTGWRCQGASGAVPA
jgi:hypothetical protein